TGVGRAAVLHPDRARAAGVPAGPRAAADADGAGGWGSGSLGAGARAGDAVPGGVGRAAGAARRWFSAEAQLARCGGPARAWTAATLRAAGAAPGQPRLARARHADRPTHRPGVALDGLAVDRRRARTQPA